jgi:uncharacterized integral membrane protein
MWLLRWLITIFFILLVLLFAIQNQEQEVSVRILNWQSSTMPLYLLVYVVFWFLFSAAYLFALKSRERKIQRENRKIKEELNRLRNANIEEELEPADSIEGNE